MSAEPPEPPDPPPPPRPGIFEMLWDCPYCATRGLLGQRHRHCPQCGAPQDPARRYFPPLGAEVAARNTTYDGADRVCPGCGSPCAAAAHNCSNCGSPLAGAAEVARVGKTAAPLPAVAAATVPRPRLGCRRAVLLVLAGGVVAVALLVLALTWKKPAALTIVSHSWRREIAIERLQPVADARWCDDLPAGAYDVHRSREVRSHRQVADGERCHAENIDRGDGTFERREVCETQFREEPVYDQRCRYRVDRWVAGRSLVADGVGLLRPPSWPAVGLPAAACAEIGCERSGPRDERYLVTVVDGEGRRHECAVSEAAWRRVADGARLSGRIGVISGRIDCTALLGR